MIQLRPYQLNAIDSIRKSFASGIKSVLLCSATGSGKTVLFSYMVKSAIDRGTNVLILTNRIELLTSTGGTLGRFGVHAEVLHKKNILSYSTGCIVAMEQTLKRRTTTMTELKSWASMIIVDECHYTSYDRFF